MPKLSSFAGMSARGFGEFGTTLSLITTTFTSSTTWVAPAGVTNLISAVGKGENGTPDSWPGQEVSRVSITTFPLFTPTNPAYLDWSSVYGLANTIVGQINAGAPSIRTVSFDRAGGSGSFGDGYVVSATTSAWGLSTGSQGSATVQYTASYNIDSSTGVIPPISGNVDGPTFNGLYGAGGVVFYIYANVYSQGPAGASSTGFGQTFPGGAVSGGAAPTTTFNNVAVTPGTSYSIVIPTTNPSPYITIQYYAPT